MDAIQIDMTWHAPAKEYLARLGFAEWQAQNRPMGGRGRWARRYQPTVYHTALIGFLNRNDEQGFKALKALEGYASALGF